MGEVGGKIILMLLVKYVGAVGEWGWVKYAGVVGGDG